MTLLKYGKLAVLPKRCHECDRVFIFEKYKILHKFVGINNADLKMIMCEKCIDNRNKELLNG